jgi:hypothetical protein
MNVLNQYKILFKNQEPIPVVKIAGFQGDLMQCAVRLIAT